MINEFRTILVLDSLFMTSLMRFLWTSVSLDLSVFWMTRKVYSFLTFFLFEIFIYLHHIFSGK